MNHNPNRPAQGASALAHRVSSDAAGRRCHVWEVYPSISVDGTSPPGSLLNEDAAHGWLAFQSGNLRRRFSLTLNWRSSCTTRCRSRRAQVAKRKRKRPHLYRPGGHRVAGVPRAALHLRKPPSGRHAIRVAVLRSGRREAPACTRSRGLGALHIGATGVARAVVARRREH